MKSLKKVFASILLLTILLTLSISAVHAFSFSGSNGTLFIGYGGVGGIIFDDINFDNPMARDNPQWSGNQEFITRIGLRSLGGEWSHVNNGGVVGARVRATTADTEARAWAQNGSMTAPTYGPWKPNGPATNNDTHTSQHTVSRTFTGGNTTGWNIRFR